MVRPTIGAARGLLVALLLAGCAGPQELATTEAGLRLAADEAEARLRASGRVVRDPELDAYLRRVLCRIVGERCAEFRLYVLDQPGFNAAAWPNGVIEIRKGALLRLENEAQLALVLGHEAIHYQNRHVAQLWGRAEQAVGVGALVGTVLGLRPIGEAMGVLAALSYSRDMEREADRLGLERLAAAGYDPNEAPRLWAALLEEKARIGDSGQLAFLSTHPTDAERIAELRAGAARLPVPVSADPTGRAAYRAATARRRGAWLAAELRARSFAASEILLDRLRAAEPESGELLFFAGELRRLRDGPGDAEAALALYEKARGRPDTPVEVWRSTGLVALRLGRRAAAKDALATYLARAPTAPDRALIEQMLEDQDRP